MNLLFYCKYKSCNYWSVLLIIPEIKREGMIKKWNKLSRIGYWSKEGHEAHCTHLNAQIFPSLGPVDIVSMIFDNFLASC